MYLLILGKRSQLYPSKFIQKSFQQIYSSCKTENILLHRIRHHHSTIRPPRDPPVNTAFMLIPHHRPSKIASSWNDPGMTFSISFLLQSTIPIEAMNSTQVTPPSSCLTAIPDNLFPPSLPFLSQPRPLFRRFESLLDSPYKLIRNVSRIVDTLLRGISHLLEMCSFCRMKASPLSPLSQHPSAEPMNRWMVIYAFFLSLRNARSEVDEKKGDENTKRLE